jgi:hypothetical protein
VKRLFLMLPVVVLPLAGGSGCAVLGVATYKLAGPPANPAKYTPAKTPLLILVENYRHQTSVNAHADLLARQLFGAAAAHDIAPLVPLEELQALRDAKPLEYPTMPVNRIAQAVGASQVMYVQLQTSDVEPILGGEGYNGSATATVKMIDASTGETLWPTDMSEGYPVSASTKMGTKSGSTPMAVRQKLYGQLTEQISHLFYKWSPEYFEPEGFEE